MPLRAGLLVVLLVYNVIFLYGLSLFSIAHSLNAGMWYARTQAGGHVPFAKAKGERRLFEPNKTRDNNLPDPSNPGPGAYNHHIKVSSRKMRAAKAGKGGSGISEDRPTAAFASDVPQLHDAVQNYRATLPGPANYRPLDGSKRNKVLYTGVAAFGSHTDRTSVFDPAPDEAAKPGPGSYSGGTGSLAIGARSNALAQASDYETAFGSTAERPCLAPTRTATVGTVGPGAYGDSRTFSALTNKINHMAKVGARGVFSTTAVRFQPDVNVDGSKVPDGPGVGRYTLKQPRFQRDREGSSFQSTSRRRARPPAGRHPDFVMVGDDSTPAPGAYDTTGHLAIGGMGAGRNGATGPAAPFSASAPRLRQDEIFGKVLQSGPGPGNYTTDKGTLASKVRHRTIRRAATAGRSGGTGGGGGGGGFGGSTVRFQKEAPTPGSLGAGYDPNSMVKKSFNRKAGYKPTKALDRRVVRSHAAYGVSGSTAPGHPRGGGGGGGGRRATKSATTTNRR